MYKTLKTTTNGVPTLENTLGETIDTMTRDEKTAILTQAFTKLFKSNAFLSNYSAAAQQKTVLLYHELLGKI